MIAGFKTWTNSIYKRVRRVSEVVRAPDNSGLTQKQQDTGRKALKILGIEESEGLNKQELVIFLYAVGLNPTDDVIDSKLRAFKLHDLDKFSFGHVCHIWQSMLQDLTDEEEILRRAFQFFDKDGNGEISIPELRTTMHELGDLLSEEEILAFMAVMDVNNDGVIGFEEFIGTLKTQVPELVDEAGDEDEYCMESDREEEPAAPATATATATATAGPAASATATHTSIDMAGAAAAAADPNPAQARPAGAPPPPPPLQQPPAAAQPTGQAVSESVSEPFPRSPSWRNAPRTAQLHEQLPGSFQQQLPSASEPPPLHMDLPRLKHAAAGGSSGSSTSESKSPLTGQTSASSRRSGLVVIPAASPRSKGGLPTQLQ